MLTANPTAKRVHVISCIGIDREYALLAHFLRHYVQLGVPPANFHIVVHMWRDNPERRAKARALFESWGMPAPVFWIGHWSGGEHWRRRRDLQQSRVPADHWVIHADGDELHEYPADLSTFIKYCERRRANCVQGPMIDRVAADGQLAAITSDTSLEDTFPVQADVRYLIGWTGQHYGMSGTVKIMLARSDVLPRSGGHQTSKEGATPKFLLGRSLHDLPQLKNPRFRFSLPIKVHHYKWHYGLWNSLSERRKNTAESPASHEFSARLVDYLTERGHIELDRLPQATPSSSPARLSWQRQLDYLHARDLIARARLKPRRRLAALLGR